MNIVELIFDGGLAILLIVTIGYCSRLSRRIRLLQDSRSELAGMISQFDQATGRAMTSLGELQTISKRITDALQLKIEKANFLADDLAFLIEKSTKLSAEMEKKNTAKQVEIAAARPKPAMQSQSFLEPAVKPKLASYKPSPPTVNDIPTSIKSASSLEALLDRLAYPANSISSSATAPTTTPSPQGLRTQAERELHEALKSGRS